MTRLRDERVFIFFVLLIESKASKEGSLTDTPNVSDQKRRTATRRLGRLFFQYEAGATVPQLAFPPDPFIGNWGHLSDIQRNQVDED